MKNRRNYYRILHVQPDAPSTVIKATHRTLMQRMKMHPDLGGDHLQAVLINEAFAVLSDPDKRAAYDRSLNRDAQRPPVRPTAAKESPAPAPPPRPTPTPTPTPRRDTSSCGFCSAIVSATSIEWPDSTCPGCGSALFTAETHQAGEVSRRTIERLPRNMPMTFRLSTSRQDLWSGTTEDISLNGMRFLTETRIKVGDRLRIECQFCSAVAAVKSVRADAARSPARSEVGVEFLTLRIIRARGGLVSTLA